MIKTTRRGFMVGCSTAIAAMAGARLNFAAFGAAEDEPNQDIMVVVFLRGGCDALSLIAPMNGHVDRPFYEANRPELAIPGNELLGLGGSGFGLHPSAAGLRDVFNTGDLAIVQATGMHSDTRSHFDAMAYMELGTPDDNTTSTGWITRHLQTMNNLPPDLFMPALSANGMVSQSLVGQYDAVAINSLNNFNMSTGPWGYHDEHHQALTNLYGTGNNPIINAGKRAMEAVNYIETSTGGNTNYYTSHAYPSGSFGNNLEFIAQMIKLQLGLRVATVDLGGWDTHEYQAWNGSDGYFSNQVEQLSQGLTAFYADLASCASNYAQRTTVVVMSEFGRRLRENDQRGTDHGHGSMMMVMGKTVNGGMYGNWPGLNKDLGQLYQNTDLAVTTDYRRVLSEVLNTRMENNQLSQVFPGYSGYSPMGIMKPLNKEADYAIQCNNHVYVPMVDK